MYQNLIFTIHDGVARISLNRPEVLHALSLELIHELTQAIKEAEMDQSVRIIILTAEGDKAFCSGADLKSSFGTGKPVGELVRNYYNPLIEAIRAIPKPVLCRLNGLAVGAGCSLALACDLTIASEAAYLSLAFVHIGLMPDSGATFFLPRLVGMARAFELASTGRKVSALEAVEIGLISRCVPVSELDQEIEKMITYYRSASTEAIGAIKQVLNQSYQRNLSEMLELEALNQEQLGESPDARERITAFLQKKRP